jgi:hypothetical protein
MDLNQEMNTLKRLFKQKSLLDVAIQVEGFLDDLNIYAYPNWFDGQIVGGPNISRYWVQILLKYPYKSMPDPNAAKVLAKVGVKCKFIKDTQKVPVKVEDRMDYRPGTKKPKLKEEKIWIIELKIPRRFLDEAELEDLEVVDDEVDVNTVSDAVDQGIDKQTGTKDAGDHSI